MLVDVSFLPVSTCPDRSASTASWVSHSSTWPSVFPEGKVKVASARSFAFDISRLACPKSKQYPIRSQASTDNYHLFRARIQNFTADIENLSTRMHAEGHDVKLCPTAFEIRKTFSVRTFPRNTDSSSPPSSHPLVVSKPRFGYYSPVRTSSAIQRMLRFSYTGLKRILNTKHLGNTESSTPHDR